LKQAIAQVTNIKKDKKANKQAKKRFPPRTVSILGSPHEQKTLTITHTPLRARAPTEQGKEHYEQMGFVSLGEKKTTTHRNRHFSF